MPRQDNDELLNDFEIEITNLDRPASAARPERLRLLRQRRKTSLALTSVLFLLISALLLASTSDVRNLVLRTLVRPEQTAVASGLHLYLAGNPSWGQFTLDGAALSQLPGVAEGTPLTLPAGSHQITWHAAPFQTRTCSLLVINASTITGSCARDHEVSMGYIPGTSALIVSFFASLNDLPLSQRTSFVQQMQTALTSYGGNELIYPGEAYAVSEQEVSAHPSLCPIIIRITLCYARASQPLVATLNIQADTTTSANDPCVFFELCSLNHLDCRHLCPDLPVIFSGQAAEGWNVLAAVRLLWSYATPAGSLVASEQPDTALRGVPDYQLLSLHITRQGQGWTISLFASSVTSSYTDPLCGQAIQDTTELVNTLTNSNQGVAISQWSDQQTHLASGCLEITEAAPGAFATPTPTPASQQPQMAYCLFRFGVVLAANSVAHKLWPYLPVANAYEQGVAQRLYSLLPL